MPKRNDMKSVVKAIRAMKEKGSTHEEIRKTLRVSKPTIVKALRGDYDQAPAPATETAPPAPKETAAPPQGEPFELKEKEPPKKKAPAPEKKPDGEAAPKPPTPPSPRRWELVF